MKVISADSHLDLGWLPEDTFTSRVPSRWKDRVPRIVETPKGPRWIADDNDISGVAGVGTFGRPYSKGRWQRADKMAALGLYDEGQRRPSDPVERLRDQDSDGVRAEVIYGLFGVNSRIQDLELASVITSTFNDWFAEFCAANPDRYVGLANLPTHDAGAAVTELRRTVDLGFRAVVLDVKNSYRPVFHKDWFPVWEAAQDLGVPLSFHRSGGRVESLGKVGWDPKVDDPLIQDTIHFADKGVGSLDYFGIILGGALDAFPDLKVVLAEAGVGWIPNFLEAMDFHYENEFHSLGLKLRPSEYWQRQMYATFEYDPAGMHLIAQLGEDHIMFASDYPHPSGIFPDSQKVIHDTMSHLPESTRSKIVHDNAASLYGLK